MMTLKVVPQRRHVLIPKNLRGETDSLADPSGVPGTPPGGPNSFIFMQFSAKH